MTPFQRAYTPEEQRTIVIKDLQEKWLRGDPEIRAVFQEETKHAAFLSIRDFVFTNSAKPIFKNDMYQVTVFDDGEIIHLSIKRNDREPIHDWRDLQEIKNQLVGVNNEAIEIYPAEARRVDSANQYHLWVFKDPTYRIPIGFDTRLVAEGTIGQSKQRPFATPYEL